MSAASLFELTARLRGAASWVEVDAFVGHGGVEKREACIGKRVCARHHVR